MADVKVNLLGEKDLLTKRRYFEAAARSNMEMETQQIIAFVRRAFHQKKQIVAKSNMYECQLRLCRLVFLDCTPEEAEEKYKSYKKKRFKIRNT